MDSVELEMIFNTTTTTMMHLTAKTKDPWLNMMAVPRLFAFVCNKPLNISLAAKVAKFQTNGMENLYLSHWSDLHKKFQKTIFERHGKHSGPGRVPTPNAKV
jgi:alkyl hydroperoxide reductase subunit AhpC